MEFRDSGNARSKLMSEHVTLDSSHASHEVTVITWLQKQLSKTASHGIIIIEIDVIDTVPDSEER